MPTNGNADGLLHHLSDWSHEVAVAILAGVTGWLGWFFSRYTKDRRLLDDIEHERTEYHDRFGGGLVEHTQDQEDMLDELDQSQQRCERIHAGIPDGETWQQRISKVEAQIMHVDDRLTAYIIEQATKNNSIERKLDTILEKVS